MADLGLGAAELLLSLALDVESADLDDPSGVRRRVVRGDIGLGSGAGAATTGSTAAVL